jgi:hypothetical protein
VTDAEQWVSIAFIYLALLHIYMLREQSRRELALRKNLDAVRGRLYELLEKRGER